MSELVPARDFRVSPTGEAFIKSFERLRLTAYTATGGERYFTIGWGHYGPDVQPGQRINVAYAQYLFNRDLSRVYAGYRSFLSDFEVDGRVLDALSSLLFNCGLRPISNASRLIPTAIRSGSLDQARNGFLAYNKQNGEVLPGLARRREAEIKLFEGADPDNWVRRISVT